MEETSENLVWNMLNDLSNKRGITEIVINDPRTVFVEREGQFIQLNVNLPKKHINDFINEVAVYNRKECHKDTPILDGNLPDGSRINVITEPFAKHSPAITIRKYLKNIKTFKGAPGIFGLNNFWAQFFQAAVVAKMNIIVSGGTGVGKTTFLNLLLNELASQERVVTIEDTIELSFSIPNLVRLEAGSMSLASKQIITIRDLVKNTLRMRPDRIIIGEVRGGEIFDLLQAMNTGHSGSMTSVHANSSAECLSRIETLYLMAGYEVPYHVIRRQVVSAVDFIVQLSRTKEGDRIVSHVSELTGIEADTIQLQTIASYDDGVLKPMGLAPTVMDKLHNEAGLPIDYFNIRTT